MDEYIFYPKPDDATMRYTREGNKVYTWKDKEEGVEIHRLVTPDDEWR